MIAFRPPVVVRANRESLAITPPPYSPERMPSMTRLNAGLSIDPPDAFVSSKRSGETA